MNKTKKFTIDLSPAQIEALQQLALEHKLMWGSKPSVTALIQAIADRVLLVHRPDIPAVDCDYFGEQIQTLKGVIDRLAALNK